MDEKELKKEVINYLKSIDVEAYNLDNADKRIAIYINECIGNPDGHNLYELCAVRRFFYLISMYEFRVPEVRKFVTFYERLKFSGVKGLSRYKLTPVQVFQFANILAFYHPGTKKRLVRDALLFVPRKFSKTTSIAALAVYDLLFGDANAQAYVAANSYQQSQVCFGEIKNILKAIDPKFRHFKINREQIFNRMRGKTSFARCLASNPDTLDGLNASTVIVDEYSQADSSSLKNVLTSSMGARLNPLTVVITTASEKEVTPFTEMLETYKAILRGEIESDSVFAHIFQPDAGDDEADPKTWHKVQPHMGVTVYEDFYIDAYKKSMYSADDAKEFRTKLLNVFCKSADQTWIEAKEIESHHRNIDITKLGTPPPTMVAIDLSVKDDFSTVTYNMYDIKGKAFHSITDYYLPENSMYWHPNRELYKGWVENGYLKLCKGSVIDYQQIVNDILDKAKYLSIMGIGYDPYKAKEFINLLYASNVPESMIIPIKQTNGSYTSPIESFELALNTDKMTFNPNPITGYCFANAVLDEDKNMNRKPIKRTHNLKIDASMTNLMTFHLFNNLE